jgi:hypothetical protein
VNKSFGCVDAWGRSNPSLARPSAASLVLHRTKPPPLLASIHPARSERKPRHDTVAGRCATHKSPQPTNPIRASPGGGRAGGGHGMCGRPRHAHYSDASLAGKRREPSPSEARPLLPCPCRPIELAAGLPAAGAGAVAVAVAARHRRRARGWGGFGSRPSRVRAPAGPWLVLPCWLADVALERAREGCAASIRAEVGTGWPVRGGRPASHAGGWTPIVAPGWWIATATQPLEERLAGAGTEPGGGRRRAVPIAWSMSGASW